MLAHGLAGALLGTALLATLAGGALQVRTLGSRSAADPAALQRQLQALAQQRQSAGSWASAAGPGAATPTKLPSDPKAATLEVISLQQVQLLYLIGEAQKGLNEQKKHVNIVLNSAKRSAMAVQDFVNRTMKLNATAMMNKETDTMLRGGFPGTMSKAQAIDARVGKANKTAAAVEKNIDKLKKIKSAIPRADEGLSALQMLKPQLEKLEEKVSNIESKLYGGNITLVVDDAVDGSVTNIAEDASRGFAAVFRKLPAGEQKTR